MLDRLKSKDSLRLNLHHPAAARGRLRRYLSVSAAALAAIIGLWTVVLSVVLIRAGVSAVRVRRIEKSIGEIPGFETALGTARQIKDLEAKLDAAQSASVRRSVWARRFSDLTWAIPWESWLNTISISGGGAAGFKEIALSGGSLSNEDQVRLIRKFEEIPWVEKVVLEGSHQEPLGNDPKNFSSVFSIRLTVRQ